MKQNQTITKTVKDDDEEPFPEPEIETREGEGQPSIETPLIDLPQERTLAHRKQEARKPLYLKRYE